MGMFFSPSHRSSGFVVVRARNLGLKLVNLSARLINTTVWLKAAAFANRKVPRADCPEREGRTMRTCCARCCSPPFHKDADADRPELSGAVCIRPATGENSAAIRDTLTRGGTRGERFASAGSKGCSDDHKSKNGLPAFYDGWNCPCHRSSAVRPGSSGKTYG